MKLFGYEHLLCSLMIVLLLFSALPIGVCQFSDDWSISDDWLPASEFLANVTVTVGVGGLLWINGTVFSNSSIYVGNATTLVLAATPTNANYSFSEFNLNGTYVTNNPAFYMINVPDNSSFVYLSVEFVAEPIVTPDPDAVTADDAVGLAVVGCLVSVAVCGGLVFYFKKPDDT